MILEKIINRPIEALDYLERIVNNGSISGFTSIHTTSKETNPFLCNKYNVKKLWTNRGMIKSYGYLPEFCKTDKEKDFIFIHPDWLLKDNLPDGQVENAEIVIPTSSSRTVRISNSNYYLKLCYPGKLGRLYRDLKFQHLSSGIEITRILNDLKSGINVPNTFDFMPEIGGKILKDNKREIGFIVRKMPELRNNVIMLPAFSLYSKDKKRTQDDTLLEQILTLKRDKNDFFLNNICYPLIDIFFCCALNEGLIMEMHSQNVLFVFDENWNVIKIVLRDFESVDKDITIRNKLKKDINLMSYPYKFISEENEDYYKRHSFMYDFKLGEYLLSPLIQCASKGNLIEVNFLESEIKAYVRGKYKYILDDFFKNNHIWYVYPKTEIDRTQKQRPFIAVENPKYR